jgi:hypothetical protein
VRGPFKGLRSCLALAFGAVFLVVVFLTRGCVSHVEVARVPSPDGTLEAVLIETNGGATTSFGYRVRLQRRPGWLWGSREVASLYGAFRSKCAYGVNLRWTGARKLRVEYLEAQFANAEAKSGFGQETVSIDLHGGIEDPKAPCGGMEYNMRDRRRLNRPRGSGSAQ